MELFLCTAFYLSDKFYDELYDGLLPKKSFVLTTEMKCEYIKVVKYLLLRICWKYMKRRKVT